MTSCKIDADLRSGETGAVDGSHGLPKYVGHQGFELGRPKVETGCATRSRRGVAHLEDLERSRRLL